MIYGMFSATTQFLFVQPSGLFDYLHSKSPESFSSLDQSYLLGPIVETLDQLFTLERSFDETNWEIILLPVTLCLAFGQRALHFQQLIPKVSEHLIPSSNPMQDDGVLPLSSTRVSWMQQEPVPVLQRILADSRARIEMVTGKFYLSGDLLRIFRILNRRDADKRKYTPHMIMKGVLGWIRKNPQVVDPFDPSIYHIRNTVLSFLGCSSTLHHSQLVSLVLFHCRSEPYTCPKVCPHCSVLL